MAVVKSCHHSVAAACTTRPRDLRNFARIAIVFNFDRFWLIWLYQPSLFPPASPMYLFYKVSEKEGLKKSYRKFSSSSVISCGNVELYSFSECVQKIPLHDFS